MSSGFGNIIPIRFIIPILFVRQPGAFFCLSLSLLPYIKFTTQLPASPFQEQIMHTSTFGQFLIGALVASSAVAFQVSTFVRLVRLGLQLPPLPLNI